jgi:plastocyanin
MPKILAGTAAALVIGCGGGATPSEPDPAPTSPVLTTVFLDPSVNLYSTPPGNTIELTVTLKDQHNAAYTGATSKSFSSNNTAVATITGSGTVTGLAIGTAQVTVTVEAGGVTRTGTTTVNVQEPPSDVSVVTHEVRFEPVAVHLLRGGTVTWTIGRPGILISHNVIFTTPGAPADIPVHVGGELVSRQFATPGSFTYECTLHGGMTGTVHVH